MRDFYFKSYMLSNSRFKEGGTRYVSHWPTLAEDECIKRKMRLSEQPSNITIVQKAFHIQYYALINRECGPYAKIFVVTSCRTDRTK